MLVRRATNLVGSAAEDALLAHAFARVRVLTRIAVGLLHRQTHLSYRLKNVFLYCFLDG